jgi:hypothetical protein
MREPCPYCGGDVSDGRVHGRVIEDGPVQCVPPDVAAYVTITASATVTHPDGTQE